MWTLFECHGGVSWVRSLCDCTGPPRPPLALLVRQNSPASAQRHLNNFNSHRQQSRTVEKPYNLIKIIAFRALWGGSAAHPEAAGAGGRVTRRHRNRLPETGPRP
ncbi:hypothetical protein EVAR_21179_1 [Eumeta japonica]|uniref:Uncharacterized protein n=1 Tax=Eumeta variegata TaxID=151549 RepID=A0A4C1UNZ1_EUMVA|nr:hypothetical protein EVAR_21179_1 [Eumeta japonica]